MPTRTFSIKTTFFLLVFSILSNTIMAQYEGYRHFDKGMFTDKRRYKKLNATVVMNPFVEFRVDTAFARWGLKVEKIGFRSHPDGFQEAIFFKQPVPDVKCYFALIVFDKDGRYMHAQDFEKNVPEFRQHPMMTFVDYSPKVGDVVLVKFIKAEKIAPAKFTDAYTRYEQNAEWIKTPIPHRNDLNNDQMPDVAIEEMPIATEEARSSKPDIPKHLKTGKPQFFRTNEKLCGFVLNDSILIPLEYEELDSKYADFMVAKRRGIWGAINKKGEAVLPFEFVDLRHSKKGTLLAMKSRDYGLISRKNEVLVPFEFRSANPAFDSVLIFIRPGKQLIVHVLNEQQVQVLGTFDYEYFEQLGGSERAFFAAKPSGGKYGIVNLKNEMLLPFEYEKISWAKGNFVGFSNAKEFRGLANLQNQVRIPAQYRSLNPTENPNVFTVSDERWKTGVVDSMGKVIVPIQYNDCYLVSNSSFVKCKSMGGHWGLWDTDGKKRTEELYEDFSVNKLAPELVLAQLPGSQKWLILDRQGKIISREPVDGYYFFQSGFKCEIGDKSAIFDLFGKQLTGFVYTNTQRFDSLEEAERQARKAGLPEGVLLVCRAMNPAGVFVFVDNLGKEFPIKI